MQRLDVLAVVLGGATLDDGRMVPSWKVCVLVVGMWLALAGAARADTITPTRFDDPAGAGACPAIDCSLRQAIDFASAGDTVALAAGTYSLTQGAALVVSRSLTVTGAGRDGTVIDGQDNRASLLSRIMKVTAGTVSLRDFTFARGSDDADEYWETCSSPCTTINFSGGGALFNQGGDVTVARVRFDSNRAPVGGGVATSSGTLSLTDVDFVANYGSYGAGLFVRGGTVTVDRSTLRDSAGGTRGGGAFVNGGTVLMTNSTVSNNGASNSIGGGVVNRAGSLTLRNVTLAGNVRGGLETDSGTTSVQNTILGRGAADGANGSCVPAGQSGSVGGQAGPAITNDLGNNLSEDSTCSLTQPSDFPVSDARLAPAADNGGSTPTAAVLHGSAAIDHGNAAACSPLDQRGVARQGTCDIGAFEAERRGAPTVISATATDVGVHEASLSATLDLAGEAGALSFEWGTSPQALTNTTEPIAAGVIAGQATRSLPLWGLERNTTYYFRAVADNATGRATGPVQQFKTIIGPPLVSDVEVDSADDTSAALRFTIDPVGAATRYVIAWESSAGSGQTSPVDIGSEAGPRQYTRTVTGLEPDTQYILRVIATSSEGESVPDNATAGARTMRQIAGSAGEPVTLTDSSYAPECPPGGTIDWGDGTAPQSFGSAAVQCSLGPNGFDYTLTVTHTYASSGHYYVAVAYSSGENAMMWAKIVPAAGQHALSVTRAGTGSGRVTGAGIACPDVCSKDYADGSSATLTAVADAGSSFTGWSGACTGTGTCTVTLDEDTAVTAQFTKDADPPSVNALTQDSATDTSVRLNFEINTGGAPTSYKITYASSNDSGETPRVDIASSPTTQEFTRTLAGLKPATEYTVRIVATNQAGTSSADGGTISVKTVQRITATTGSLATLTETGSSYTCPTAQVDWGDDSPPQAAQVQCSFNEGDGYDYTLTASHTYAGVGRYHVQIAYSTEDRSDAWAQISATLSVTLAGTGAGRVTGAAIDCPGACSATVHAGDQVTLAATPAVGSTFAGWSGACTGSGTCTFTVDGDENVSASFAASAATPTATSALVAQTTPTPVAPPTPTFQQTVVVTPAGGTVLVRLKGAKTFVALAAGQSVPLGSQIDVTKGRITLTSVPKAGGAPETATFYGGIFTVTQVGGITTLTLSGPAPSCGARASAGKKVKSRKLWGDGKGAFRTRGEYSAATVRGTRWLVQDTCAGTLTKVAVGVVAVRDNVKRTTVILRARKSYLARPKRHR